MGKLRDKIGSFFSRKKKLRSIIREYYGGDTWLFARAYASSIYNIPEVRTAIEAFADIFSTIPKYLERVDKSGNITYLETNASRVLTMRANPLQNATQFWKDVVTRLMLDCNVFIEPIFDRTGELRQLYILPRDNFEFKLYDTRATVTFNGIGKTYDIGNLIYLNRFSDISGGKRADLGLYETVIQALAQQAINVADPKKPRAIMQGKLGESGNFKEADRKGTMQAVKANFDDSAQGIVYFDSVWEITPINWQENDVNRELMKLVINVVMDGAPGNSLFRLPENYRPASSLTVNCGLTGTGITNTEQTVPVIGTFELTIDSDGYAQASEYQLVPVIPFVTVQILDEISGHYAIGYESSPRT